MSGRESLSRSRFLDFVPVQWRRIRTLYIEAFLFLKIKKKRKMEEASGEEDGFIQLRQQTARNLRIEKK